MSFLGALSDQISSQFNIGENTNTSLDAVVNGQQAKYGSLGDFASQFDQSSERRYVEEGYLRRDPYNTDPKIFEVLWQEPESSVYVKKRMFTSVAENFRPDFMDQDEKLYYRTMKILFQNKCSQISALEKLGKIQEIVAATGEIDTQLMPFIFTLTDTINNGFADGGNLFGVLGNNNPLAQQDASQFIKTIDRLRTLYAYNTPNMYTNWLTDNTNMFQSTLGQGTGVIEITNSLSISTTTTINPGGGNCTINISDPYEAMLITDYDIEKALSDATNGFYSKKSFQFGLMSAEQVIADTQNQLNSARAARKASPITFKIDPNTLLGKRVTAILDRQGLVIPFTYDSTAGTGFPGLGGAGGFLSSGNNSVQVPPEYLQGGGVAGFDGLSIGNVPLGPDNNIKRLVAQSELTMFQNLIAAIFTKLQLMANSAGAFTTSNKFTNYARRKLRFNFSGKLIIQPMDSVHIYMSTKTRLDNKILSGLTQMFSGSGILQNINNTSTDIANLGQFLGDPTQNVSIQAEKNMYVGPDFPNYLWLMVRSQFITEKEGAHVFGGLVDNASSSWSDGKFTIDVACKDNTAYFDQGKVNFKPGMDTFNGAIFDPLTPFKSAFDSVNTNNDFSQQELLEENKFLLSETGQDTKNSIVKFKLGPYAGQKVTQSNYIQDQSIDPVTGRLLKVFYAPDGLVYKWKEGIGVFTRSGSTAALNNPNLIGTFNIDNDPFQGLDVMNVLSLLITGVPYNFSTFFRVTQNLNGFTGDPQTRQSPMHSFIDSLRNDLTKRNTLWGNFIPFKTLSFNEGAIAQALQAHWAATRLDADLNNKIQKLQSLQTAAQTLGAVNAITTKISNIDPAVQTQFDTLRSQVNKLQDSISSSVSKSIEESQKLFAASNISAGYDSSYLIDGQNDPSDSANRKILRRQINYLTRRMSYDVKANQDKSLFIVDDYYDIDYDIASFNKTLSGEVGMYSLEFTSVRDKIYNVANLLNLEVFCDSQGHIRIRPPQYNRIPSSVFYRMMYLKQTLGVQLFPEFMNEMLADQIKTLRNRIEIIEDQIRLDVVILGGAGQNTEVHPSQNTDESSTQFINFYTPAGIGGTFHFISDASGNISDVDDLIKTSNHDEADSTIQNFLSSDAFNNIKASGTSTKNIFDNTARYSILLDSLSVQNQSQSGANVTTQPITILSSTLVQNLITRIQTKSGQLISAQDYITSASPDVPRDISTNNTIDFFKVTQEIASKIQEWQAVIKLFYHTIKNTVEYRSLDDDSSTSSSLLTPGLFQNSHIPEVYEHMIEDESYDDLGPGSGQRYIIKRVQIKNIRLSEMPPPWTSVEVQGTLPFFSENEGPPGFQTFPSGGNGLVTALAIDYDMWRNYGFKQPAKITVPFLSDPESQCGPYATILLSRNRAEIFGGSVTIAGNEYMQPGEVVYLEDRNMLFYVTTVQQNFAEGGQYTTTLTLTYGHTPGQYIPTYMDSIGKLIYNNRAIADTVVQRQDSSATESNMGVIQRDGSSQSSSIINTGSDDEFPNQFSESNSKILSNILYNAEYMINANSTRGRNIKASVEFRVYYDDNNPVNKDLQEFANGGLQYLNGVNDNLKMLASNTQPVQNAKLPKDAVTYPVVIVNLSDDDHKMSPSQKAIDAARNQIANSSSNTDGVGVANSNNDVLRKALFSYIVDCWISFVEVPATVTDNSTADSGIS